MKLPELLDQISRAVGSSRTVVVDAENSVLGRVCTVVAKLLIEGYRVYVVNAEKAVVSGERRRVVEGYKLLLEVSTHRNPYKGIKRPRTPEGIFKRTVRGMLPRESDRGFKALKRLRVFTGSPQELGSLPRIRIPWADASRLGRGFVFLGDIARELGWKG